jgi:hypothetical protein
VQEVDKNPMVIKSDLEVEVILAQEMEIVAVGLVVEKTEVLKAELTPQCLLEELNQL